MNTFVLRNSAARLGFELGFFNLFALAVLIPGFWFLYAGRLFGAGGCFRAFTDLIYLDNLDRLLLMGSSLASLTILEGLVLRLCLGPRSPVPSLQIWRQYLFWMLVRSLPVIAILLALIALPHMQLTYCVLGLFGLCFLFSAKTGEMLSRPDFTLNQTALPMNAEVRTLLDPRNHLKGLLSYLALLGVFIPCLLLMLKLWPTLHFGCGDVSSVKANMHTFQTILETYAVDWDGKYPENIVLLEHEGRLLEYWKDFRNPFFGLTGKGRSYAMMPEKSDVLIRTNLNKWPFSAPYRDVLGIRIFHESFWGDEPGPGMVLYDPISPSRYHIYGLDKHGKLIIDKGRPLTLSNS